MSIHQIVKDFNNSLSTVDKKKTSGYDSIATVTRVEGTTAWVHIPGGVVETPVLMTSVAKPNDQVMVRVENGVAYSIGNSTSPPTDDTTAIQAAAAAALARAYAGEAKNQAEIATEFANTARSEAAKATEGAIAASEAAELAHDQADLASRQATELTEMVAEASEAMEGISSNALTALEAARAAEHDADLAKEYADSALTSATLAAKDASDARTASLQANESATAALFQLSEVENVLGTLNWIAEHGYYSPTADTAVQSNKLYYVVSGTEVEDPDFNAGTRYYELVDGKYIPTNDTEAVEGKTYYIISQSVVSEPKDEDLDTYYELLTDSAISQYISSHLALSGNGLEVFSDQNSYRLRLASDGAYIIDPQGHNAAVYGESIYFDPTKEHRIGNNNVYIEYYASTPGGLPDSIRIKADSLTIGSEALDEKLEAVDRNIANIIDGQAGINTNINKIRSDINSINPSKGKVYISPEDGSIIIDNIPDVGSTDPATRMTLNTNMLQFLIGGNVSSTYSSESIEVPTINTTILDMRNSEGGGDLYWIMRSNQHLSLKTRRGLSVGVIGTTE